MNSFYNSTTLLYLISVFFFVIEVYTFRLKDDNNPFNTLESVPGINQYLKRIQLHKWPCWVSRLD